MSTNVLENINKYVRFLSLFFSVYLSLFLSPAFSRCLAHLSQMMRRLPREDANYMKFEEKWILHQQAAA